MAYKILYIEDLEAETRNLTFKRDDFDVISILPSESIDKIINDINDKKPDLIILDYILTEGSDLKFCNALFYDQVKFFFRNFKMFIFEH